MAAVQEGHGAASSSLQVHGAGVGFSDAQSRGFVFAALCFRKQNKRATKPIKPGLYLIGRELLQHFVLQLSVKLNSYTSSLGLLCRPRTCLCRWQRAGKWV